LGIAEGFRFMSHLLSCDLPESNGCAACRPVGRDDEKIIAGQGFAVLWSFAARVEIDLVIQALESRGERFRGSVPGEDP
jgi:hypothetical protein